MKVRVCLVVDNRPILHVRGYRCQICGYTCTATRDDLRDSPRGFDTRTLGRLHEAKAHDRREMPN